MISLRWICNSLCRVFISLCRGFIPLRWVLISLRPAGGRPHRVMQASAIRLSSVLRAASSVSAPSRSASPERSTASATHWHEVSQSSAARPPARQPVRLLARVYAGWFL